MMTKRKTMTTMTMKRKTTKKKVPMRTCIATGKKLPKSELMRFVKVESGEVKIDPNSKLKGRGANLTMTLEAFDLAIKKKAFQRALKLERTLSREDVEELRKEFEVQIEEKTFRPKNKPVTIRVSREKLETLNT